MTRFAFRRRTRNALHAVWQIGKSAVRFNLALFQVLIPSKHTFAFPDAYDIADDDPNSWKTYLAANVLTTRAGSRILEPLTHVHIPTRLRSFAYRFYEKVVGDIKWHEFKQDLKEYPSFHEFFTRRLERPRAISPETDLVSPVDGKVVSFGELDQDTQTLEQIKGVRFKLHQFLQMRVAKDVYEKGHKLYYAILYLSPADYHRFHSPSEDLEIDAVNHVSGQLLSVNPSWLKRVPGLFTLNERVVMTGKWKEKWFFAYVPVGAYNVGSIHLTHDKHRRFQTNHRSSDKKVRQGGPHKIYLPDEQPDEHWDRRSYEKGEEIGYFSFGSTVVLIFEAPNFEWCIHKDQKVSFGDDLGNVYA
eukprot:CAMPEP_0197038164 /NCGR_PEP_ID=MMETSP1384-20130603/15156_1 /TAXON_ID=29189 /ORGANISM="Ammonia sp." /LENGTH=358 /DNA_ID=CAMNT_0042468561 /DNA_START=28 /DNA_END=1104 /DNA_ORIENTATION=-